MNSFSKNFTIGLFCSFILIATATYGEIDGMIERRTFRPIPETHYKLTGFIQDYISAISENWLMVAPDKHPEMLDFLATREEEPHPFLVPWAGEFYGKYLTSAVQTYRITRDPKLRDYISQFVEKLIALQAEDGYLGVYDKSDRLKCKVPKEKYNGIWEVNWDLWGHYFGMMGLTLWYETTGDEKALSASRKIGDMLCEEFLGKNGEMGSLPEFYTNLSPGHSLCLLYRVTGEQRYLDLARQIVDVEFGKNVDYMANALAGMEFYQNAVDRWEALHEIMAMAELYWLTGRDKYKQAFEQIWWSIAEYDRFNHGAFTSGEEARGNPYDRLTKETCCTIAWCAMSVEMLKLTGNSIVADELELSLINAVAGYQSRKGDYCHYHTPMDGKRPPISGLNCCTANGARGFGLLSEWALMQDKDGLVLNWYGPANYETVVQGVPLKIAVLSDYPREGKISIEISSERDVKCAIKLRIPRWSEKTTVTKTKGQIIEGVKSGHYLPVIANWNGSQTIEIELDMGLHFWIGEKESGGCASIYRGPVLMAMPRQNVEEYVKFDDKWKPYVGATISTCGSNQPGARFTYKFEGDEIHWTGAQSNQGGKAEVRIDGKLVEQIDQINEHGPFHCYSPVWAWHKAGLGTGSHEMEVIIADETKEKPEDNWISVLELVTSKEYPIFDLQTLNVRLMPHDPNDGSIVKVKVKDINGQNVLLCDFDSAGEKLNPYISWLRIKKFPGTVFSRENPLRSVRATKD